MLLTVGAMLTINGRLPCIGKSAGGIGETPGADDGVAIGGSGLGTAPAEGEPAEGEPAEGEPAEGEPNGGSMGGVVAGGKSGLLRGAS
ncbi:MAG: hypothetical protein K2X38_12260 [Gemmataceae bacterium]|nr:hypothetical protein [Gemmataceae bacterium]